MPVRFQGSVASILACAMGCFGSAPARADDTQAQACIGIMNDTERLACYDRALRGDSVPAAHAQDPAATATPRAVDPIAEFGLSESQKRAQQQAGARDRAPDSITGTVSRVDRQATGGLIMTLDNGQVWVQAEALTMARVQAGDLVTIRKAALGSHLLVTPGGVAVRVRRVR